MLPGGIDANAACLAQPRTHEPARHCGPAVRLHARPTLRRHRGLPSPPARAAWPRLVKRLVSTSHEQLVPVGAPMTLGPRDSQYQCPAASRDARPRPTPAPLPAVWLTLSSPRVLCRMQTSSASAKLGRLRFYPVCTRWSVGGEGVCRRSRRGNDPHFSAARLPGGACCIPFRPKGLAHL